MPIRYCRECGKKISEKSTSYWWCCVCRTKKTKTERMDIGYLTGFLEANGRVPPKKPKS